MRIGTRAAVAVERCLMALFKLSSFMWSRFARCGVKEYAAHCCEQIGQHSPNQKPQKVTPPAPSLLPANARVMSESYIITTYKTLWYHFEAIYGPCITIYRILWYHYETMYGPIIYNFGTIYGPFTNRYETIMRQLYSHVWPTYKLLWDHMRRCMDHL